MTETSLKIRLGITLIFSHFGILLLLIILFANGAFKFEDLTTVVAIIVPMFAGYTTAVISFVIKNKVISADTSGHVTPLYATLSFMFPVAFTILIAAAILAQAFGSLFSNFEQFKQALVLIESMFAIYVGRLIFSIFEREPSSGDMSANSTKSKNNRGTTIN